MLTNTKITCHAREKIILTSKTQSGKVTAYGSKWVFCNALVVAVVLRLWRTVNGQSAIGHSLGLVSEVNSKMTLVMRHIPDVRRQRSCLGQTCKRHRRYCTLQIVHGADRLQGEFWTHHQVGWINFCLTIIWKYKISHHAHCTVDSHMLNAHKTKQQ